MTKAKIIPTTRTWAMQWQKHDAVHDAGKRSHDRSIMYMANLKQNFSLTFRASECKMTRIAVTASTKSAMNPIFSVRFDAFCKRNVLNVTDARAASKTNRNKFNLNVM